MHRTGWIKDLSREVGTVRENADVKYGVLKSSALNLGDEIQSVVVRQFLPRVDVYLDGCYLKHVKSDQKVRLVIHGCFNFRAENWPPSSAVEPLITSLHIGEYAREKYTSEESIRYLKRYEPIGCRDYATLHLLQNEGVQVYFSGCVSFMLRKNEEARTGEVILADLDREASQYLPTRIRNEASYLYHGEGLPIEGIASRLYRQSPRLHKAIKATKGHLLLGRVQQEIVKRKETDTSRECRFQAAEELLERYAKASLVVTSRLHAALPCLAFGTPVIFVHKDFSGPRFFGLRDYLNAYSVEGFKREAGKIDFESPAPNPRSIDDLRNSLTQTCKEFVARGNR